MPTTTRGGRGALATALLAVAAGLFVGCGETTGPEPILSDVRLVSERVSYRAGDVVQLAVITERDRSVTGGLCPLSLQRLQQGRWLPVLPDALGTLVECDAARVLVRPGDTLALAMRLDPQPPAGTYRIEHLSLRLEADGTPLQVRSNAFELVASTR